MDDYCIVLFKKKKIEQNRNFDGTASIWDGRIRYVEEELTEEPKQGDIILIPFTKETIGICNEAGASPKISFIIRGNEGNISEIVGLYAFQTFEDFTILGIEATPQIKKGNYSYPKKLHRK